ncbi:MAG: flagellar biosynthesis protein FlhB [Lachnospirales bacterium]
MDKEYLEYKNLIPLDLQFFNGEKTEEPTGKKRDKAREEGQVAKSQEISTALLFVVAFFSLNLLSGYMYEQIVTIMNYTFQTIDSFDDIFVANYFGDFLADIAMRVGLTVLPLMLIVLVLGVITNVLQVGWKITTKPLQPKFSKLNPIQGFKRIFSMRAIMELIKSIAKLVVICYVVYNTIKDEIMQIFLMFDYGLEYSIELFGSLAVSMGISVGVTFLFIGVLDLIYQRWKLTKDLRMSKQEIKDEYKEAEGNPEVKGKIKSKMREAAMRRMMQDLPSADVIITNPTHFAVAIKYDNSVGSAPKVVAKGQDFLALKIREIATEHDITIVENKPLARTLYASVDIGKEIPQDLYQAVAEVLAYVYKLKNKI